MSLIAHGDSVYQSVTAAELSAEIERLTQQRDAVAELERQMYGACVPQPIGEWDRILELDATELYDDDNNLPEQLANASPGSWIDFGLGGLSIDRLIPQYDSRRRLDFTRVNHGGFNPSLNSMIADNALFNAMGLLRAGVTYQLGVTVHFGLNTHEVLQHLLDQPGQAPWWRLLQIKNVSPHSWYNQLTWAIDWYRVDAHKLVFLLLGDSRSTKPQPGDPFETNEQRVFDFDAQQPLQVRLEQRLDHIAGWTRLHVNNQLVIEHTGPNCVQRTDGTPGTEGQCRGIYCGSYLGPCKLPAPLTVAYSNISIDVRRDR